MVPPNDQPEPRKLVVTQEQFAAGYRYPGDAPDPSSRPYTKIRDLDDGCVLVLDPHADYLQHYALTPAEIEVENRQGSTTPIPWSDPKDFAAASRSTLQELKAVQALAREAAVNMDGSRQTDIPVLLKDIVPNVGDTWEWEPLKAHARQRVRVTAVRWNGEEVWVESEGSTGRHWNDLGRWVEATVLVKVAPGHD